MGDIRRLIAKIRQSGALIELASGDRVRFKRGAVPIPRELIDELRTRKAEVIEALRERSAFTTERALFEGVGVDLDYYQPACPEFVGSRTILRHPGYSCGRCSKRYDDHDEVGKKSASLDVLARLAQSLQQ